MPSPQRRLGDIINEMSEAHGPDPKHERRRLSIARSFKPDPRMERLIELKTEDPAAYRQLTHGPNGIALGHYVESKKHYEELKGKIQ